MFMFTIYREMKSLHLVGISSDLLRVALLARLFNEAQGLKGSHQDLVEPEQVQAVHRHESHLKENNKIVLLCRVSRPILL